MYLYVPYPLCNVPRYSRIPRLRPSPGAPGQWRGSGPAAATGAGQGSSTSPDSGPGGRRPLLLSYLPQRPDTHDPWGANAACQQVWTFIVFALEAFDWCSYLICSSKMNLNIWTAITRLMDTEWEWPPLFFRCLDESEESAPAPPPPPGVPDCPICGKKFKSQKSRSAHLKRCSSDMGVASAVLLQALQRQAEETQNVPTANRLWVILPQCSPAARKHLNIRLSLQLVTTFDAALQVFLRQNVAVDDFYHPLMEGFLCIISVSLTDGEVWTSPDHVCIAFPQ